MLGTVKFWNGERGFGFIAPDGSPTDVFLHVRSLPPGVESVGQGDRVSFEVEEDPSPRRQGRRRATNVSVIAEAPPRAAGGRG